MVLKGKYEMSVTEFKDCLVSIENGIIHSVIVENVRPMDYFIINPKENSGFEYYKLPTKKGLVPIGLNYKLQYENKSGNTNTVLLSLSKWKVFCIKWQQKGHWIQKTDNWIKFLIPIVTGVVVFLITKKMFGC